MTTTRSADTERKPRRRHGLGADGIQAVLDRQGGGCAICHTPAGADPGTRLAVDHDHAHCAGKTGCPDCVRGLLCVHCNNILRSAKDDPAILRRAIAYLAGERPRGLSSDEVLAALYPDDDYRLLPTNGRRDRLYMNLLEAPLAPQTLAEVGWMEEHDPTGLAMAMARMDRRGHEGAFEARYRAEVERLFAGPERDALVIAVRAESRRLTSNQRGPVIKIDPTSTRTTMDGRITVDGVNLEDINTYLRRKAREDRLDQPAE
ncbi:MAG: endonuclease VII domain-containing protein [Chloroflexota bacterium]